MKRSQTLSGNKVVVIVSYTKPSPKSLSVAESKPSGWMQRPIEELEWLHTEETQEDRQGTMKLLVVE